MLTNLFIGMTAFVLMGIPVLVVIAFFYGIMKAGVETKHKFS